MAVGTIGTAIGQGMAVNGAVQGIARQPEASGTIQTNMIIGLAFVESLAIYALVIALLLLFANPFAKADKDVAEAQSRVALIKAEADLLEAQARLDAIKQQAPAE